MEHPGIDKLNSPPSANIDDRGSQPFIETRNVNHFYIGGDDIVHALSDISMQVRSSEFVSIVGRSGCGKTTLLKILAGLLKPSDGEITIDQKPVKDPYPGLGMMFQSDLLLDWRNVLENVLLQCDIRGLDRESGERAALELLRTAGLDGFERSHVWELSGGMRQRVAVCRSLVHDPELLLMDEPFGALDALTRTEMNQFLQNIWITRRPAVVLITHSVDEAVFLSDRVLVMSPRPGRLVDQVRIDLPRPRDADSRRSPEYQDYTNQLMQYFLG